MSPQRPHPPSSTTLAVPLSPFSSGFTRAVPVKTRGLRVPRCSHAPLLQAPGLGPGRPQLWSWCFALAPLWTGPCQVPELQGLASHVRNNHGELGTERPVGWAQPSLGTHQPLSLLDTAGITPSLTPLGQLFHVPTAPFAGQRSRTRLAPRDTGSASATLPHVVSCPEHAAPPPVGSAPMALSL